MPPLQLEASPIKAIIAADSGSGKTGMLVSLAEAGFKLRIYDADNGTRILSTILRDKPEVAARIEVAKFINRIKTNNDGFPVPIGRPSAWPDFLKALNQWPDGEKDEGPNTWGPDTVIVIDSLTILGRHALLYAQYMENKAGKRPELQHYNTAGIQIEALFQMLYGDNCACHVLYLTHVKQIFSKPQNQNDEPEFIGAFPNTLGKALNNIVPRYVNDILTIKVAGEGPRAKRYLSTKPTANRLITKTSELAVKDEYLFADGHTSKPGLANYFEDCGWPPLL